MSERSENAQVSSKERNILDLAKNLQDELHVYCKGAAGSGDNFYARTFANLADRADELVKLLESAPETNSCAKFRIGDDVVVTRWHAPAKVKGFIYELEDPFQYPERERDLSPPAQKAVDQRAIDANALADAHRMYEAEHDHPFSESEGEDRG